MSYTISSMSDDSDNSGSTSISWASPVWWRDAGHSAEWNHGLQAPPPSPTPSESSHAQEDGLHLFDLDDSIRMWVTLDEAEHARILARAHAEQMTHIQELEGQLYNSQAMLAETAAENSVQLCELGLALSRAKAMIKTMVLALILHLVVCVMSLFLACFMVVF